MATIKTSTMADESKQVVLSSATGILSDELLVDKVTQIEPIEGKLDVCVDFGRKISVVTESFQL